jgi:hypothetical protein
MGVQVVEAAKELFAANKPVDIFVQGVGWHRGVQAIDYFRNNTQLTSLDFGRSAPAAVFETELIVGFQAQAK